MGKTVRLNVFDNHPDKKIELTKNSLSDLVRRGLLGADEAKKILDNFTERENNVL